MESGTSCIESTHGYKQKDGYYKFHKTQAVMGERMVHRWIYKKFVGSLEVGEQVRHLCHNRGCINPEHLDKGSNQDNVNDTVKAGRNVRGETNVFSILKESQVLEIRRLHKERYSIPKLAEKFSITERTIHHILDRKTWKHI